MKWGWASVFLVAQVGCSQFGNPPSGSLPRDIHAPPDPREVAEHPCRFGDAERCVARCEAGDSQACNGAGVLFEFSDGTTSDPAVASRFYRHGCRDNYGPACNNLAWLYLSGRGVPKDPPQAMFLFMAAFDASRIACYRGDASGCLLAGELLYEGHVDPSDDGSAVAFFKLACELGEERGCDATGAESR